MMTRLDVLLIFWGVLTATGAYWLAVVFYSVIPVLFPVHAARYKIQERDNPPNSLPHLRLMALTVFNQVPLTLAIIAGSGAVYFACGGETQLGFPAWPKVLFHFLGWVVIFELGFYASHRLLHSRWLYRHVHVVHHRFKVPLPYCAACVHPIEFVMSYIIPTFGAALLLHFSYAEFLLFLSAEYVHNVHDHCGYFYWWDPFRWVCFQKARMHEEHHRRPTVNFGVALTGWPDRFFGTYALPEWTESRRPAQ